MVSGDWGRNSQLHATVYSVTCTCVCVHCMRSECGFNTNNLEVFLAMPHYFKQTVVRSVKPKHINSLPF